MDVTAPILTLTYDGNIIVCIQTALLPSPFSLQVMDPLSNVHCVENDQFITSAILGYVAINNHSSSI